MRTGETLQDERRVGTRDIDGQELVLRFVVSPVGQGPPYPMVLTTGVDVTGTVRAREQARRGLRPSGPLVTDALLGRLDVVELARAEAEVP